MTDEEISQLVNDLVSLKDMSLLPYMKQINNNMNQVKKILVQYIKLENEKTLLNKLGMY